MKRTVALSLVMALLLCLLTGCGKQEVPAQDPAAVAPIAEQTTDNAASTIFGLRPFEEEQTLRIGFFAGSQVGIPFLVAMEEGFYKELNIKVELVTFTNGPAMMEANADWDIASAGVAGALVGMIGYDLPTVGIADRETNQVLFVRKDSAIAKNPDDPEAWRGTQWMYPSGTTAHLVLSKKIDQLGLTMSDIESVNMDVASAYNVFSGGDGDGVVLWSNFTFKGEDDGYVRVADASSVNAPSSACLIMTPDAMKNKRELMVTAWSLYYLTVDWFHDGGENSEKALKYYYESCLDEGISCTEDTARRTYELYLCPGTRETIGVMTEKADDPTGTYTSRKLLAAENEILTTMDFFISQNTYTPENRNYLLDSELVDNSIALEAEALLKELGVNY